MKPFTYLTIFILTCISIHSLQAQVEVRLTINSGLATTTCTDLFSPGDPLWQVNIDNQGWATYPLSGFCYNALPNIQYTESYTCPAQVPSQIQVCFQAFDNDDILALLCQITPSCLETICQNFSIPAIGSSSAQTLALPAGLSSGGQVNFTIETISAGVDNDLICNAVDFGPLAFGQTLGDAQAGGYNNLCATNTGEPDPNTSGFFINDGAVWYSFTTGPNPGGEVYVHVLNDPLNTGDDIDAEVMVYTSSNGTCTGALSMLPFNTENSTLDNIFRIFCPAPNTTYYVMVDGGYTTATSARGYFGIEVVDIGVQEGADLRCNAENLGIIPEGGSVSIAGFRSNFCATSTGDPTVSGFVSQHSVWFRFIAPASGHVIIEALTDRTVDSIGIQLALFRSFNNTCTGFFSNIVSSYTFNDLDETLEATCLYEGTPYWILVDGDGTYPLGSFTISVNDAGDITPVTMLDTVLCFGETLTVGTSSYQQTGQYADTLQVFAGCDSIIISNVTVLPPLDLTITQTMPAVGLGGLANGVAIATATGGAGSNYQYTWCSGETGPQASMLLGGQNCCVTVTDLNGCQLVECFTVDYVLDVVPVFENDTLLCFGDENGQIVFHVEEGLPPYTYTWQNALNTLSGSGLINTEGESVTISDLPAGDYFFTVADAFSDSTFTAIIIQPALLEISLDSVQNAACFGQCNGSITVNTLGGVGSYAYNWSSGNPATTTLSQLCAGSYSVTVTDTNGCWDTVSSQVGQPPEFIATASLVNPVSCFDGADGEASVSTNGSPINYQWSNGGFSANISGLEAGFFDVTVTNADGCQDVSSVQVTQPNAPLEAFININSPISCFGFNDGSLSALAQGPYSSLNYQWSTGANTADIQSLIADFYTLTITNEKGCTATDSLLLGEPDALKATLGTTDITCVSPLNGGGIQIQTVTGGTPDYLYALDEQPFSSIPAFNNLFEGPYLVTIQDAAGCEVQYDISVAGPPVLEVTLGDDQSLQLGDTLTIAALANSNNLVYKWTPADTSADFIRISPILSTAYTVEVFDTITLCKASDAVFITITKNRPVFIPNAFSPNNDGQNDVFMVFGGVGIKEIKSMRVFARGGNLVFEQTQFAPNDPTYGWDGTFRGRLLNPGVFVYALEIEFVDGLIEVFKGDVTLLR